MAERKKYSFEELMRQQNLEANRKVYAFYSNKENLEKVSADLQEDDDSLLKSLLESAQRTIAGIEPPLMLDSDAIVYSIHKPAIEEELKSEGYNGIALDKLLSAFPSVYVIDELHRIDNNGVDKETGDLLPSDYTAAEFIEFMYDAYTTLFKGRVFSKIKTELKKPAYKGITIDEIVEALPLRDIVDIAKRDNAPRKADELAGQLIAIALAGEKEAEYPQIQAAYKPSNYAMLNTKAANKYLNIQDIFMELEPNGQLRMIPAEPQPLRTRKATKTKSEVITLVSLSYTGDLDGKAAKVKSYDQSVLNSISSLWQAGNMIITKEDIYKTITQKTKPTKRQLDRIEQSLQKFSGTKIRLDITQELNAHLITIDGEKITGEIIEENMLYYRKFIAVTERGKEVEAIQILKEPILYTYSKAKKQIIEVPVSLLEIKGNATEDSIVIRDYLLKEINQMKRGFRDNNNIKYDSILSLLNKPAASLSRTEKSRVTATVCDILDTFREKEYIKNYVARNGQKNVVLGFEIKI